MVNLNPLSWIGTNYYIAAADATYNADGYLQCPQCGESWSSNMASCGTYTYKSGRWFRCENCGGEGNIEEGVVLCK